MRDKKKLDIETEAREEHGLTIQIVRLDGSLDSSTFPWLQEAVNRLITEGHYYYLFDLTNLKYISSAGLGVLKGISREVREKKGDLRIANMAEEIERIFNLLGLSRTIPIYDSVEQALQEIPKGPSS